MSVLAMVKMTVFPKKRTELLQTLETLKNSTCTTDLGCMQYRFYQEGERENNIILMVEWQTQENLAAYQNSDQYKILRGAISLLCESSEMSIGAVPSGCPQVSADASTGDFRPPCPKGQDR